MNLDLTAAIEAAYRAHHSARRGWEPSQEEFQATYSRTEAEWMGTAVAAAAPLIAAQVGEQIAAAIEAEAESRRRDIMETAIARGGAVDVPANDVRFGVEVALRIARRLACEAVR